MSLLPCLAACKPDDFIRDTPHTAMNYLLTQLKKEKDRPYAFVCIGEMSLNVGCSMNPYLDTIMTHIRDNLGVKARAKPTADLAPVFQCLGMLAQAIGQALTKHVQDMLDAVFSAGMSPAFQTMLTRLSEHIVPLLPELQQRLLELISVTLSGKSYMPPGAPKLDTFGATQASQQLVAGVVHAVHAGSSDPDAVLLALSLLGTFDFSGHALVEFIRDAVLTYLDDENPDIRRLAALTACRVLVKDPVVFQANSHSLQLFGEILSHLLSVAIADMEPSIRLSVLLALDTRFDPHLAQSEHIRSLCIALNDEVFAVREVAVQIIGRLTTQNPAHILPPLRRTLIQLLAELEYSATRFVFLI